MFQQGDSDFFIKPNAFTKLYKHGKPKTQQESQRKIIQHTTNNNKKQLNILHFSKPLFLLNLPNESASNRNQNSAQRSLTGISKTPEKRKIFTSPTRGKLLNQQELDVPYEIHSQLPISCISPKYVIQQKQGCAISRLPNFKLQLINQLPTLRQQMMKQ